MRKTALKMRLLNLIIGTSNTQTEGHSAARLPAVFTNASHGLKEALKVHPKGLTGSLMRHETELDPFAVWYGYPQAELEQVETMSQFPELMS